MSAFDLWYTLGSLTPIRTLVTRLLYAIKSENKTIKQIIRVQKKSYDWVSETNHKQGERGEKSCAFLRAPYFSCTFRVLPDGQKWVKKSARYFLTYRCLENAKKKANFCSCSSKSSNRQASSDQQSINYT